MPRAGWASGSLGHERRATDVFRDDDGRGHARPARSSWSWRSHRVTIREVVDDARVVRRVSCSCGEVYTGRHRWADASEHLDRARAAWQARVSRFDP